MMVLYGRIFNFCDTSLSHRGEMRTFSRLGFHSIASKKGEADLKMTGFRDLNLEKVTATGKVVFAKVSSQRFLRTNSLE